MPSRDVLTTTDFRVFPSIGQLVEGYLLITPKAHYAALDEMPAQLFDEFSAVHKSVRTAMSAEYGPSICFEHGARAPINGGCGIYHAHLHILPFGEVGDPTQELKNRFPYEQIGHFRDIAQLTEKSSPYLFYEDAELNKYVFLVDNLPSQYMRRRIAETLGGIGWDWRNEGREDRLLQTLNRLSSDFESVRVSSRFSENYIWRP